MQAQALKAAKGNTRAFRDVGDQLDDLRASYLNGIKASNDFAVREMRVVSQSEAYTKRLKEQKAHLGEIIGQRKLMNQVIKDQINLQRASAVSWRTDPQGRIQTDLIIPKNTISNLQTARMHLGAWNAALRSAASETVKWGKNTQWAGRQLMVGFTVPLGIAAAATGKMAYDIDKALTSITKVYGDATQSMQDSTETIRQDAMNTATNMAKMYGQTAKDTLEIEAQFAAAGKTGMELQQASAAATKARMLNEIDLQTAIQASITMQTVYGYSAQQLGEKWDYINAVANQTILSAEDFATAIPKVSGVLKELGASLEDVGVLMTAMKSAGIDAAEGANALKTISFRAVAPYGRGMATFKKMTGEDLSALVRQANGELIPLLNLMNEEMTKLSKTDKIQVFKDVFGIYQGNKALNLLEQLSSQSEQVAQAMAVGKNSIAENAMIANQELARMNEQPYKQIEKAIARIQIEMAKLGETVLPMVSWVLELVGSFIEWMNSIDRTHKILLLAAAAFVGLAGPATMLVGLFANMVGTLAKFGTGLGALITRFKFTDAAERAQILTGKQATQVWDQQTSAVARLTMELQKLNETLGATSALGFGTESAFSYVPTRTDRNGNYINQKGKQYNRATRGSMAFLSSAVADPNGYTANAQRLMIQQQEVKVAEQLAQKQAKIARNISMGVMAAGGMATALGPSSPWFQGISQGLFMVGSLGALFPSVGARGIKAFQSMSAGAGNVIKKITGIQGSMKGAMTGLMSMAKSAAVPLTIAVAAIAVVWEKARQDAEEAANAIKASAESTQAFADLLGYNMVKPGDLVKQNPAATGQDVTMALADQLRKAQPELAKYFSNVGGDLGEKWALAINEGVKVKLSGGTEDAAKEATRVALQLMGETFSDAEFETTIKANIDFNSAESQMRSTLNAMQTEMNKAIADQGEGWDRWTRDWINGGNDLTQAGAEQAKKAADNFWSQYSIMDASRRREFFDKARAQNEAGLQALYGKTKANGFGGTFDQFIQMGRQGNVNMSAEDLKSFGMMVDYLDTFNAQLAAASGHAKDWKTETGSGGLLELLIPTQYSTAAMANASKGIDITEELAGMHEEYARLQEKAAQGGKELSDAERLKLLNLVRTQHGLSIATSLTQGFNIAQDGAANSAMNLADALKSVNSALDESQAIDAYREVITNTQSAMVDAAMNSLDAEAEASANAISNSMDAAMDSFDKKKDALDKKYAAAEEGQKARQEKTQKAVESYYDARIKKINDAIDAEKKAEDERERLFDLQKQRLERMSQMFNKNVDLNSAISSGNFDEAAKIANDMASSSMSWAQEDANAAAKAASDKRVAALEDQKSALEKQKDARLEALKKTEDAENKALQAAKDREMARLDAAKEASRKMYENRKRYNQMEWDDKKRKLQLELDTIRAFIPRNKAELDKQAADIDAAYRKYGVKLTGYGDDWAKYVGNSFLHYQQVSANKIQSDINWQGIGTEITNALLKGGFGMTAAQFAKWLGGNEAPLGSVFNPKYKMNAAQRKAYDDRHQNVMHTGGVIGQTQGKRTGYSGDQKQSEIWINALKGESILNRKATDWIGTETIMALNKGKYKNTGGWEFGQPGAMAGGLAGATQRVMSSTIQAVADARKGVYNPKNDFAKHVAGNTLGSNPTIMGPGTLATGKWTKPLTNYIKTSEFGMRKNPVTGIYTLHGGIDLAAPGGTPIYAAAGGRVIFAGWNGGTGNFTKIDHGGGIATGYGHQSAIGVKQGQIVRAGQMIGRVGTTGNSTGNHLHFEYFNNGVRQNPRLLIPGFSEGAYTLNSGLAMLHPRETVLSEPLSNDLHTGLSKFADGGGNQYNVEVVFQGTGIPSQADIKRGVKQAIVEIEREKGPKRKLGDK